MVGVFMPTIYFYNGLPVCVYRVRVNRFTDIFHSMLTKILSCGIIKNDKKARLSEGKQDLGSERSGCLPEVYYFIIQKPYRFDTPM